MSTTMVPDTVTKEQPKPVAAELPEDLQRLRQLGRWLALAESGVRSEAAEGAAATMRLYYAQQLDLPPQAVGALSMIKGRLVMSAELLRALAERAGYRVVRLTYTDQASVAALVQISTGQELGRVTFTIEDAERAGLIRPGSAWTTHPARMLWARASKFAIQDFAPAVGLGILTDDEAAEMGGPAADLELEPDPDPADEGIEFSDPYEQPVLDSVEVAEAELENRETRWPKADGVSVEPDDEEPDEPGPF